MIVPALDDAASVGRLLVGLPPHPSVAIIIVDGGHDATLDSIRATRADVQLLRAPAGRGGQMNTGAAVARGRWLLFLHADSQLPPAWLDAIEMADRDESAVGGWFRFSLDAEGWQPRLIERLVALRVTLLRLPYGDQGIFVRRAVFAAMGGYRDLPLMEDVEFVRRLIRTGPVRPSRLPLVTSARRWHRDGWFRRSASNLALLILYVAGVSPHRLARWYG